MSSDIYPMDLNMKCFIGFLFLLLISIATSSSAQCDLGIIPCPTSMEGDHGEFFLSNETEIVFSSHEDSSSATIFND